MPSNQDSLSQVQVFYFLFQRLQSVQNAAARLIVWTGWHEPHRGYDKITGYKHVTADQWNTQILFKLAILMYKALHSLAPPHLSNDCLLSRLMSEIS